ncbi:unnamed protein product [Knipowitschia caucasica]
MTSYPHNADDVIPPQR